MKKLFLLKCVIGFILVVCVCGIVVILTHQNGKDENTANSKKRHQNSQLELIDVRNRKESIKGEYSIGEYLELSQKNPSIMYYVDGDSKDSEVIAAYVFNKGKVAVFPKEMIKWQFGQIEIGNILKLDDADVIKVLLQFYEELYTESMENLKTNDESVSYLIENGSRGKWFNNNATPFFSGYDRFVLTDKSGEKTEREVLLLPSHLAVNAEPSIIDKEHKESLSLSYYGDLSKEHQLAEKGGSCFIEFSCDEVVSGSFYGIPYVGIKNHCKEKEENNQEQSRFLIAKKMDNDDFTLILDNPTDKGVIVDPTEIKIEDEKERLWKEYIDTGYEPFELPYDSHISICIPNNDIFVKPFEEVKQMYPNVFFECITYSDDEYKSRIMSSAQENAMPDVFYVDSCSLLEELVKKGRVCNVDKTYELFSDALPEKICRNMTYDGMKYGIPLTMNIVSCFANMDVLESVGYDKVPETYEDLIECCEALKASNIIPFGCTGHDSILVADYVEYIIMNSCGAKTLDDIFRERAGWNNADVASAVDSFQELIRAGYFDASNLDYDAVRNNFMAGKYAFYMDDTWNCFEFAKDDNLKSKVVVSELPIIKAEKAKSGQIIGGSFDALAVAYSSDNAALATEVAFNLGKCISRYGYLNYAVLPTWKIDYEDATVNALSRSAAEIVANSDYMVMFGESIMHQTNRDLYLKYMLDIFSGEIDGKAFVKKMYMKTDSNVIYRDLHEMEVTLVDWWSGDNWNEENNAYEEAYWEMQRKAMRDHNYTFTRKNVGIQWGKDYTEAAMLAITNNEPLGSIITFDNTWVASFLAQGAFLDVSNLPSIDWSDSKWNKAAIEVMTINGGIYGFASDFEPRTGVFFNKNIFKQLNIDTDLPYQLQAEGKWSWNEFEKLCENLTKDTNNDGTTDIYGVTGQNTVFFTAALMTNGTYVITKDDSGKLIMNAKDAKVLEALNWAHKILDEGYFSLAKEGDEWDYFKADFFDGEAAMWVEEEYAVSQCIAERGMDVGFVTFPYGPAVGHPIAICREYILIIPNCPSTKDIADDIAYAYNIFTDVPEGFEEDDAKWKASYETLFTDEKAVTETINWIINKYDSYMNDGMLIADFRPDWLYQLGDANAVPSSVLKEYSQEWQKQVDEFNNSFFGND